MSAPSWNHHDITWADIAAADIDRELAFYSAVLQVSSEASDGGYHSLMSDGSPVGGAMQLPPEMSHIGACWSLYVSVADADATVEAVKAAGGTIYTEPFAVRDGERVAVIADPTGGVLCLFEKSGAPIGVEKFGEPGSPSWFECNSTDVEATKRFLSEVFGWRVEPLPEEFGEFEYWTLYNGDKMLGGLMPMPEQLTGTPTFWVVYYQVENNDEACQRVTENGGTVVLAPWDTPFGRIACIQDPGGATLMLRQSDFDSAA